MYGYFLFREENIKERFLGAVLMLIRICDGGDGNIKISAESENQFCG